MKLIDVNERKVRNIVSDIAPTKTNITDVINNLRGEFDNLRGELTQDGWTKTNKKIDWDTLHYIEDASQHFLVRFLRSMEKDGEITLHECPEDWDEVPDLYDFIEDLLCDLEIEMPD